MSIPKIKKMDLEELYEIQNVVIDQLLNKSLKNYEEDCYEEKSPNDKFVCPICNGTYVRKLKKKHFETEKHYKKLKELKRSFTINKNIFDTD